LPIADCRLPIEMLAVSIQNLTHRYGGGGGERTAIDGLNLDVPANQIFGILGPNGSGKTTLFRILSTLISPQQGDVRVLDLRLPEQREQVRRSLGVVFQAPSLDRHLTAEENLRHHGHLYGVRGTELKQRINELLDRFQLRDRARERVERFSGGMRRRVELAKGLLHRPRVLLLDEPSTGLDPRARIELMEYLRKVRDDDGASVLLTTHLMEEAEQCDRLAIMDAGRLVACDSPAALRARVGGDVITLRAAQPAEVKTLLRERLSLDAHVSSEDGDGGTVRIEHPDGHELLTEIVRVCGGRIDGVSVGKPTLTDVFIHLTGRSFAAGNRGDDATGRDREPRG
jgi:ABC-2 type transport system ATP-binding protein